MSFSVSVAGTPPALTIHINLPDGMEIATLFVRQTDSPCANCQPFIGGELSVKNGAITVVPQLGDHHHYMTPRTYQLILDFVPESQPPEIKKIIGEHGENLAGPY